MFKKVCKIIVTILYGTFISSSASAQKSSWKMQPIPIQTRWAREVNPDNVLPEYPRPQLKRKSWKNLNGLWDYIVTDTNTILPKNYKGKILVPFPIESALSGVQQQLMPNQFLWCRRYLDRKPTKKEVRTILNFGAVDWQSTIYVNGTEVGNHKGGYTGFNVDITDYLVVGRNELIVRVYDPTDMGPNPHGKQTLRPQNIFYTASSGIWQTVWAETVSPTYITDLNTHVDINAGRLTLSILLNKPESELQYNITVLDNSKVVNESKGKLISAVSINIPNAKMWSPEYPHLYDLIIQVVKNGEVLDEVSSYFGMRTINIQKDSSGVGKIFLNGKPYFNFGVLDQGFWPEGLYTAPTDKALRSDIEAIKRMGFNTIRKHIKIEPDRWYYYADKLGILIWQDLVNPPNGLPDQSKQEFEAEAVEAISQLRSHPSIVTWVLFNERWGAYDQARLTNWLKALDSTRIVNGHSGELLYVNDKLRMPSDNPYINSDLIDIHSYPYPIMPVRDSNRAIVVGEFGGSGVSIIGHQWDDLSGWGYIQLQAENLKEIYKKMIDSVKVLRDMGLAGSIYTEPFDVEGEENGLITYDRRIIKIPLSELQEINHSLYRSQSAEGETVGTFETIDNSFNDGNYNKLVSELPERKLDSVFLRRLSLMALRRKDYRNLTAVSKALIRLMLAPLEKRNLHYISAVTRSPMDTGFNIFLGNQDIIDSTLGKNAAANFVRSIIKREFAEPKIKANMSEDDWDNILFAAREYGELGTEEVAGLAMIYYMERNLWKKFAKYYCEYYKTAYARSEYHINNMSWPIFEHINDKQCLLTAAHAMKYSIDHFDQNSPNAFDTYANILYKLGDTQEALKWQEKAKSAMPDDKEISDNLRKMKSGIRTWKEVD